MVNLLFARTIALLLIAAFCVAAMLLAAAAPNGQNAGIVIGGASGALTLAVKGIIDYDDK